MEMAMGFPTSSFSPTKTKTNVKRAYSPPSAKQICGLTLFSASISKPADNFSPRNQIHRPITCSVSESTGTPAVGATNQRHQTSPDFYQHVIVMRHGDRMDNFDPTWITTAQRPFDPPLVDGGLARAFKAGRLLRHSLGFPIHRVFVSPFLRCVQTAAQVVSALCAVNDDSSAVTGDTVPIDPSKLKASVEFGLCEMINRIAIYPNLVPKDGNWGFNVPELEAILPAGTVDHKVEKVYKEIPKWEETMIGSRTRYETMFQILSDKYPSENLLLVTHGEGVGVAVSTFMKDTMVYGAEYCAFAKLRRPIIRNGDSFTAGNFEALKDDDLNGIKYSPTAANE